MVHDSAAQYLKNLFHSVSDLRSCWLKVCFCSEETSTEGNPGVCSVSSSHWASRAGQLWFRANRMSEKCSVRLRGDVPPTACNGKRSKAVIPNARPEQKGGACYPTVHSPAGWSQSAGSHPGATPQPVQACLCIETAALSAKPS